MKLEDLKPGDVVERYPLTKDDLTGEATPGSYGYDPRTAPGETPLLYERRVDTTYRASDGLQFVAASTYVFRCLETWEEVLVHTTFTADVLRASRWSVLERSSQVGHSGSVETDGEDENLDHGEEAMTTQNLTSATTETMTTETAAAEPKAKKTRTVDYTRTDKKPHSFRYKRHSTFVARAGAVSLSKDADGAFVIGPAPEGSEADAAQLTTGQLELISVKKRPNGKTAIAFKHADLGMVVAYDARAARAALRAG